MRGWVYVLTNKSFPSLVKIGFSTKDPQNRAEKLTGTGHPHPFLVAYEALIESPRNVEQAVHTELEPDREAKEFFRVTVEFAVRTIQRVLTRQQTPIFLEGGSYCSHGLATIQSNTLYMATAFRQPLSSGNRFSRTVPFVGNCGCCCKEFAVTLTRHDSRAVCPNCFSRNDVSIFLHQAFPV